jgi:hypothetical protein
MFIQIMIRCGFLLVFALICVGAGLEYEKASNLRSRANYEQILGDYQEVWEDGYFHGELNMLGYWAGELRHQYWIDPSLVY